MDKASVEETKVPTVFKADFVGTISFFGQHQNTFGGESGNINKKGNVESSAFSQPR